MAGEPSIKLTGYAGEIKDIQDSSILNVSVHPGYTIRTRTSGLTRSLSSMVCVPCRIRRRML